MNYIIFREGMFFQAGMKPTATNYSFKRKKKLMGQENNQKIKYYKEGGAR